VYGGYRLELAFSSEYREIRGELSQELGIEPGPRLRELQGKILSSDQSLHIRLGARSSAAA
jgi:DNA-binding SARP family transcriptional activator